MDYTINAHDGVMTIRYRFILNNAPEKVFEIKLDPASLELLRKPPVSYPAWTVLECEQCPNCPLESSLHKRCPVAVNAIDVVEFFKQIESIERVHLRIETEQRAYAKDTDSQTAVASLLGIIMATSNCPILSKLRPMARFHLPFATLDETRYRAISMYLLAQFFRKKHGKEPDWRLKDLNKIYEDVSQVNRAFINRLRKIHVEDSTLNAIVKLSIFEQDILISITDESLAGFEETFQKYLV